MKQNVVKLMLRLPEDVHKKIVELAEKDKRSMNNYIVRVLESHIKEISPKEE
jgi:predicted HicB family RNase H-like nuclease